MIIALGIMIHQGFRLKQAYDYGKGLERECGDEFFERERADYQIYIEYTQNGVEKQFQTAYYLFMNAIIAVLGIYMVWVFIMFFVTTEGNGGGSIDWSKWTNVEGKKLELLADITPSFVFPVGFLVGAFILITRIGTAMNAQDGINPFKIKQLVIKKTTTPIQKETEDQVNDMVKRQYTILVGAFILVAFTLIFYKPVVQGETYITASQKANMLIIIGLGILFIPMITKVIVRFQNMIGNAYGTEVTTLNNELKILVTETNNNEIAREMEKNIVKSHPEIIQNEEPIPNMEVVESSPYKNTLFSYAKHTLNNIDIQSVQVPADLRKYVLPYYLRGESLLDFKKALSKLYQMRDGIALNSVSINGDMNNTETLFATTGNYAFLKRYFTPDIQELLVTTPTDTTNQKKKAAFVDLLNRTIITSPLFAKVNPLPLELKDMLRDLRSNKGVKMEVDKYYSTVSLIIYILVFGYAYVVYHSRYVSNPESTTQQVAFVMIVLLAIIGFLGWFTKELWL